MRWPDWSGVTGGYFFVYGRPTRTGHFWIIVSFFVSPLSVSTTATTSSTVKLPDLISFTVPLILGGIMILCRIDGVSCTVPSTSPPIRWSPALATAVKSHFFSRSSAGTSSPRGRKLPPVF